MATVAVATPVTDLDTLVMRLSDDDLRRIGHLAERELRGRVNKGFEEKLTTKLRVIPSFERCTVEYDDSRTSSERTNTIIYFNFGSDAEVFLDNVAATVHIEISAYLYTSSYEVTFHTSFGDSRSFGRMSDVDTNTLVPLPLEGWTLYDTAKLLEIVMMTTSPKYLERYDQLQEKVRPENWNNAPIREEVPHDELDLYDFTLSEGFFDVEVYYKYDTFEEANLVIFYNDNRREVSRVSARWDRRYNIFKVYKVEYAGEIDIMKYIPIIMPVYGKRIVELENEHDVGRQRRRYRSGLAHHPPGFRDRSREPGGATADHAAAPRWRASPGYRPAGRG